MEEALQVGEVESDNLVKEVEEVEEEELASLVVDQGVEAQTVMLRETTLVQHGERRDPQVQLQTGKAGENK